MYSAVTHDIRVTVTPEYRPERSDPEAGQYFWAYTIEITNLGRVRVQLVSRYWHIVDMLGRVEEVRGLGVVGEQPVLRPGQSFRYTSGCPLTTAGGTMTGHYAMVDDTGGTVEVEIPGFSLDVPGAMRILN